MSEADIATLKESYEAFNRGDMELALKALDPAVEISDRAEAPDPQRYAGIEGALRAFEHVSEGFEGYSIEPEEFIDGGTGEIVVQVRQRGRGTASGIEVEDRLFHVWSVRDGKATAMRAFTTRKEALEAAGLPPG
jgi:ketosteroid isomerase-like protein